MNPKPKQKPIRLSKPKLHKLMHDAWERDGGRCLITWVSVPENTPSHHIVPVGRGGSDVIENLATIEPLDIHNMIHHGDPEKVVDMILANYSSREIIQYFLLGLVSHKTKTI